jgi:hypothetical protein
VPAVRKVKWSVLLGTNPSSSETDSVPPRLAVPVTVSRSNWSAAVPASSMSSAAAEDWA